MGSKSGGELIEGVIEVRSGIPTAAVPAIEDGSRPFQDSLEPEEKVHRPASMVRGGKSGKTGYPFFHSQGGDSISGVQTSLGMSDEVDLFAAIFPADPLDPSGQHDGVLLHRSPAVLKAKFHHRPSLTQILRNPPPITAVQAVPSAYAVDQHNGVTSAAKCGLRLGHSGSSLVMSKILPFIITPKL